MWCGGSGDKATISLTKSLHRTAKGKKGLRDEKPGNLDISREPSIKQQAALKLRWPAAFAERTLEGVS